MAPATQNGLQLAVLLIGIGGTIVAAIAYQSHYIDKLIDDLRNELKSDVAALRELMNVRIASDDRRRDLSIVGTGSHRD